MGGSDSGVSCDAAVAVAVSLLVQPEAQGDIVDKEDRLDFGDFYGGRLGWYRVGRPKTDEITAWSEFAYRLDLFILLVHSNYLHR